MKIIVPNELIVTTYEEAHANMRRYIMAGYDAARQLAEEMATRIEQGRIAPIDGAGALRLMVEVMQISAEPVPNMPVVVVDFPNDNVAKSTH
ncbi:MAG TPA: hypothetical protein VL614_15150 [Acetobacteraceae bacterium]|nr:hypothetical protein [Acetobacteraceae bacterium]